jgi:hypothetical protein
VHALVYGKPLGLSDEQLVATAHRRADDPAWSERDARLVRFADELQDTCGVSDGVWSALAELYRDDQLLELVISVGWYRLVSYVINAVRIASPGQRGSRPDDGRGRAGVNAPRPGPGRWRLHPPPISQVLALEADGGR